MPVQADPHAEPAPPVVLDESNSYADPMQPDCRKPLELRRRHYARAEQLEVAAKSA